MSSGRIVQIIGAVVDVEFPRDSVPKVYDALNVDSTGLTLEVQQQLGDGVVRAIAMGSSEGLSRGLAVDNTNKAIQVPVGAGTLGRIMDVLGNPIDEAGPIEPVSYTHLDVYTRQPPGNATMGSGIDKDSLRFSSLEVLLNEKDIYDVIFRSETGGYDLLPSNSDLTAAEVELLNELMREQRLRHALLKIKHNYDYIVIDCPPSLNMLTLNALVASNGVIIPVQCEYFSLEGLSALVDTIDKVTSVANKDLKIEGIVRTMYDPRNMLTADVSDQLKAHFGDKLYSTVIPRNVRLAEAPSYGEPALKYDKNSKGAIAYLGLAGEIIRKNKSALKNKKVS